MFIFKTVDEIGSCRECGLPYVWVAEFMCKGDKVPRLAAFCKLMHQRQIQRSVAHRKLINHEQVSSTFFEQKHPRQGELF